ncbi:MAG: acyl-CoA dehydrogenase [Desulfobacteraceae bacterium]|nr:acyl-CoA dehydrogenase [Desulfobacteraceae bacterium]
MADLVADRRDVEFVLFDQLKAEDLTARKRYSDFDRKIFDMIIKEARNFGIREILPTYMEGDKQGVTYDEGTVRAPECFRKPFERLKAAEWTSMTEDLEYGGQGIPELISMAVHEYITGINFAFASYSHLGHGTGKMIELFGTEKQKQLFLKNLYTAHWGGTMLLTEPQAGSDVGALTTTAWKNPDGTYTLTGNKIFITAGEHDLAENIIHPVLARIEGAPVGTRGISLFIVPKFWVNDDGSLGDRNDIFCTGVEEKMGLHGSATCSMTLGENCRGMLLGEENQGMKVMFHMMNEARLGVGLQAFTHASNAYLYALNYAKDRLQGRALEQMLEPAAPQVAIINHPDVRRMLLEMKAYVEGMRSFTYYIASCFDHVKTGVSDGEKAFHQDMIELLTPVLKTYNSNKGFDVCIKAMQVHGGAGYTKDYPVEQLARDCKIASIYEGTDGIQAMDLVARKIGMKKGKVFREFIRTVNQTVDQAREFENLKPLAEKMDSLVTAFCETVALMGENLFSPRFKTVFGHSVPFLEVMGDVVMAWMLLWRGVIAATRLNNGAKKKDLEFYDGQIKTADYFINNILPVTHGKIAAVKGFGNAALEITNKGLGA